MSNRTLVISSPPHGTVNVQQAAPVLGLIPVEFNLKVHYSIPEIWLAEEDPEKGIQGAETLTAAGASVVLTAADALLAVPDQSPVAKFAFGEKGLRVLLRQGPAEIPYDYPVVGVYFTPRAGGGGPTESGFLDLYLKTKTGMTRLTIFADTVDFSGLGDSCVPSHARNMAMLVDRIEGAYTRLRLDRRLVNMQIRQRLGAGTPSTSACNRRGFSFASAGLHDLLEEIAPSMVDVGQADLSSRLVFLTLR